MGTSGWADPRLRVPADRPSMEKGRKDRLRSAVEKESDRSVELLGLCHPHTIPAPKLGENGIDIAVAVFHHLWSPIWWYETPRPNRSETELYPNCLAS